MYLRITRAQFDPAIYEQIAPVAQEVNAAIQRLPGLQQVYQGFDRAAGRVAVVSVWDNEEHAGFARDMLGEPIGRMRALGVQIDPPEIFEILE